MNHIHTPYNFFFFGIGNPEPVYLSTSRKYEFHVGSVLRLIRRSKKTYNLPTSFEEIDEHLGGI